MFREKYQEGLFLYYIQMLWKSFHVSSDYSLEMVKKATTLNFIDGVDEFS